MDPVTTNCTGLTNSYRNTSEKLVMDVFTTSHMWSIYHEEDNNSASEHTTQAPSATSSVGFYAAVTAFTVVTGIFMIAANGMVVAASYFSHALRKKTFYFVSSLAVADILTALVHSAVRCMVLVKDLAYPWLRHQEYNYCQTIVFFLVFPQLASITNLLLMGLDRFVAICYPLKYNVLLSNSKCALLLIAAWLFSLLSGLTSYIWHKEYTDGFMDCQVTDADPYYYDFMVALPLYAITLILIIMYTKMAFVIKKSTNMATGMELRANKQNSSENKITKMLFITLVVFALSWLPQMIILHFVIRKKLPLATSYVPYVIAYINSGMNFFIYTFGSVKYKAAFKKMCCCRQRQLENQTEITLSKTDMSEISVTKS